VPCQPEETLAEYYGKVRQKLHAPRYLLKPRNDARTRVAER
jgi:hypothetical protein